MTVDHHAAGIAEHAADETLGLLVADADAADFFQLPAHLGLPEDIEALLADAGEDEKNGFVGDFAPVGGDGDAAFRVEGMIELPDENATGERKRGRRDWRLLVHLDIRLAHFIPL